MKDIRPKIVYSPQYDFSFYGLEKMHPFDGQKFSKACLIRSLEQTFPG